MNNIIQQKIKEFFGGRFKATTASNEEATLITEKDLRYVLESTLRTYTEQLKEKRGEIEKILWKHYDPDMSPNMEEVAGEIIAMLSEDK